MRPWPRAARHKNSSGLFRAFTGISGHFAEAHTGISGLFEHIPSGHVRAFPVIRGRRSFEPTEGKPRSSRRTKRGPPPRTVNKRQHSSTSVNVCVNIDVNIRQYRRIAVNTAPSHGKECVPATFRSASAARACESRAREHVSRCTCPKSTPGRGPSRPPAESLIRSGRSLEQ